MNRPSLLLFGSLIFSLSLAPVEGGGGANGPFRVVAKTREIAERGAVPACQAISGDLELFYLPPSGWKQSTDGKKPRLTYTTLDRATTMSLEVLPADALTQPKKQLAAWRQSVQAEFSSGRITEEFDCYAGSLAGKGFEVAQKVEGFQLRNRVCYVQQDGMKLRFTLRSPEKNFKKHVYSFTAFMASLRLNEEED